MMSRSDSGEGRKPRTGGIEKSRESAAAGDLTAVLERYCYTEEMREIIHAENLLPPGLLNRLQTCFPQHSGLFESRPFLFSGREQYSGLEGFRKVASILSEHGIVLGQMLERELFVEVYRFKASRHLLNTINWNDYEHDPMYQLVFPQPGMMRGAVVEAYANATSDKDRQRIISEYMEHTNPHDGHQLLNKPWLETGDGGIEVLEGSQHKYPQCQLIFDHTTQSCFAFCTYCFRHAQVRGDDDMFLQHDIAQVHQYLRRHTEVTDMLITGGDAGYLPYERLQQYVMPILEDPALFHVRTVRLASRMLTFQPELILSRRYDRMLERFDTMVDNGVQVAWMAHISTPRELLNPTTIAAIRRLQQHGVVIRGQSPIMNHISLHTDQQGKVDIERSAQNWIDLAKVMATLRVGFHSMYCARPTGEHHYFTAPLADIEKISNRIFHSLSSINRPSRYITMTTSAGKVSILGETEVGGQRALALKFNEARNMAWMDKVFLARYDEQENRVDHLVPFDTPEFFFENELEEIESALHELHGRHSESPRPEAATGSADR